MKTLYLDIFSGISGDMFVGALADLGVDLAAIERGVKSLGLGQVTMKAARAQRSGIEGTKFDVQAGPSQMQMQIQQTPKGPYGGPLVNTSAGRVELTIFETGVPPRFRLYFYSEKGRLISPPRAGMIAVQIIRADGTGHLFSFRRLKRHLEAKHILPEPHEFTAILTLTRNRPRRVERREVAFIEKHDHGHSHAHPHGRDFAAIRTLIQNSQLSSWVKEKAVAVFQRIAVAEGKIHGQPPEKVHFHEVGAVDSIVDVVGACIGLELLGRPRVLAGPVIDGTGSIQCAHGRFPIPAPATVEILGTRRVTISQCDEPNELVTPTGAALLAEFVEGFGPMLDLVPNKTGYGIGTRENKTRPNVLRAVLGESSMATSTHDWETDTIVTLQTNLDDINSELLGRFAENALAAGALDVFYTPIQMKKNRPGTLLSVLCVLSDADRFTEMILRETTSFGVRRFATERRKLRREMVTVKTSFGDVRVKMGKLDGKVVQVAPEFESCKKLADAAGVPLKQVYEAASKGL